MYCQGTGSISTYKIFVADRFGVLPIYALELDKPCLLMFLDRLLMGIVFFGPKLQFHDFFKCPETPRDLISSDNKLLECFRIETQMESSMGNYTSVDSLSSSNESLASVADTFNSNVSLTAMIGDEGGKGDPVPSLKHLILYR